MVKSPCQHFGLRVCTDRLMSLLPELIKRMEHVNASVVMLDSETSRSYGLVSLAWSSIETLYPTEGAGEGAAQQGAEGRGGEDGEGGSGADAAGGAGNGSMASLSTWLEQAQSLSRALRKFEEVSGCALGRV